MGAEKHVAAQVLQRSFRRERPSAAALFRPLAPVAPSAEVEPQLVPAADLAPMDIVDATLPLHSEPTAPIDNDEAAAKIKHANKDLGGGNFLPAYVRLWHLRHAYSCAKKPTVARRGSANATVAVL